jgi:hypothetical protein
MCSKQWVSTSRPRGEKLCLSSPKTNRGRLTFTSSSTGGSRPRSSQHRDSSTLRHPHTKTRTAHSVAGRREEAAAAVAAAAAAVAAAAAAAVVVVVVVAAAAAADVATVRVSQCMSMLVVPVQEEAATAARRVAAHSRGKRETAVAAAVAVAVAWP